MTSHAEEHVEQGEQSLVVHGSKNVYRHYGSQYVDFPENWELIYQRPRSDTLGHIPKGCPILPQENLLNYVNSSFIHNSQKLEKLMSLNWRTNKENTVHFYNRVFITQLLKVMNDTEIAGKWIQLEKNHPKWGNPNPERQTWCVLTYKWTLLVAKQRIIYNCARSTDPERLINKEGSSGNAWISLGRRNRIEFVGGLGLDGDGNRIVQAGLRVMEGESTGRDDWNWWGFGDAMYNPCAVGTP